MKKEEMKKVAHKIIDSMSDLSTFEKLGLLEAIKFSIIQETLEEE